MAIHKNTDAATLSEESGSGNEVSTGKVSVSYDQEVYRWGLTIRAQAPLTDNSCYITSYSASHALLKRELLTLYKVKRTREAE